MWMLHKIQRHQNQRLTVVSIFQATGLLWHRQSWHTLCHKNGGGEGAYILPMFSDTISRQTGLQREPQPTMKSTEKGYKETWKITKKSRHIIKCIVPMRLLLKIWYSASFSIILNKWIFSYIFREQLSC